MSKRAKRLLSLVLTLVMVMSLGTPAFALGGGSEVGIGGGFGRDIGDDEVRDFDPSNLIEDAEEPVDLFSGVDTENGIQVTVESRNNALPTMAEVRVTPVDPDSVREAVAAVVDGQPNVLVAMDISFWLDGIEIEPEEPVNVKISAPELTDRTGLQVVHIPDGEDAQPEAVELVDESELSFGVGTNEVAFKANSFSVYVVTGDEDPVPRYTYNFLDGSGDPYPFLNTAGQTVTSQIIKDGESLQEIPAPGLLGNNSFVMWVYVGGDLDGQEVKFGEPITVTEDKTFTVKAFYGNVIYVTFWQYAAGKIVLERKQLAVNEETGKATMDLSSVTVPAPSTTLKFMGWSLIPGTDASETDGDDPHGGRTLLPNGSYDFTKDTDVYPVYYSGKWIVFVSAQTGMGATYVPSFFITGDSADASAAEPADPTMTGYTFDGWYTEAEPVEDYAKMEAQSAHGEEFDFSTSFDDLAAYANERDEIVLYGHWSPGQTTYVVVYWKQQVTDAKNAADNAKKYDYAGQTDPIWAATGSAPTPTTAQRTADLGFEYKRYKLTDSDGNEITGIAADQSSILNVYFDRRLITLNFGTQNNSTRYGTYTGLYGQTLAQNGYSWPSDYGWLYRSNGQSSGGSQFAMSYLGQFVLPVNRIPGGNVTVTSVNFYTASGSTSTIYYYIQNADGTWPTTPIGQGETTAGDIQIAEKFDGFTMDAYQYNNSGRGGNYSPNTWVAVRPNESMKDVRDNMAIRYRRLPFEIKYLNPLNESPVLDEKTLLYGASLSSAKPAAGAEINLGIPGYEWDGKWYKDKLCTVEFDFDNEVMPLDGTKVYAGKSPIYFFIKIDPNGGELQTNQSTWRWVLYGDDSTYTYDNITRDFIEYKNDGNPAYYYYYDEFDVSRRDDIWNYQYMASNPRTARYTTGEIPSGGGAQWLGTEQFSKEPDAYALIGWYDITDGTENMKPFKTGTAITRDTIIQAQWRRTGEYLVHYAIDAVNESGEPLLDEENNRVQGWASPTDTAKYADKSDSAILDKMGGVPAGYAFLGWWYNGKMYQPGDVFQVLASVADDLKTVHIYPVLEPVETLPVEVINITFDPNGGRFTAKADTELNAIITTVKANDDGTYNPEKVDNANGTKTINNLKINESFAILSADTVERGVVVDGETIWGRGYKLREWNTAADGSGTSFALNYTAGVDGKDPVPNVLYAIWDEIIYIGHSSDGSFDSVVINSKAPVLERNQYTKGYNAEDPYLYTTYYYGGYTLYAAADAAADGLTFEAGDVKSGTIADSYWTRAHAAKSDADWTSKRAAGAVFYIKEVPTSYLAKPLAISIREEWGQGAISALYFLTDTDTSIYRAGGVKLQGVDTKGAFTKTFTVTQNNGASKDITAQSQYGADGYLSVVNKADLAAGEYKACQGYWTTYDGITVYAIEANIKDITING